jgi:hypothetical protein
LGIAAQANAGQSFILATKSKQLLEDIGIFGDYLTK